VVLEQVQAELELELGLVVPEPVELAPVELELAVLELAVLELAVLELAVLDLVLGLEVVAPERALVQVLVALEQVGQVPVVQDLALALAVVLEPEQVQILNRNFIILPVSTGRIIFLFFLSQFCCSFIGSTQQPNDWNYHFQKEYRISCTCCCPRLFRGYLRPGIIFHCSGSEPEGYWHTRTRHDSSRSVCVKYADGWFIIRRNYLGYCRR
jgi:hypothetical protein